jgi:phage baseplate assembly protein W
MSNTYRSRTFTDISLDFTPNPITKDLVLIKDSNAIKKSVMNIIQTIPWERPYSELGSNVNKSLFELFDYGTAGDIRDQIRFSIEQYEPRVTLNEVEVFPDYDRNEYRVTVKFTIVGINIQQTLDTYLQNLRLG